MTCGVERGAIGMSPRLYETSHAERVVCARPRGAWERKRIASRPGRTRRGKPCATPPPADPWIRPPPAHTRGGRPASAPPGRRSCLCARHSPRSGRVRSRRRCSTRLPVVVGTSGWATYSTQWYIIMAGYVRSLQISASGAGRCLFKQVKINTILI